MDVPEPTQELFEAERRRLCRQIRRQREQVSPGVRALLDHLVERIESCLGGALLPAGFGATALQLACKRNAETLARFHAETGAKPQGRTRADARGFFQLTGIPEGGYVLTARTPGFAPSQVHDLSIAESNEVLLDERRRPRV